MEEGCYMASIDIKDAYFSFAINSHDQNFMFSMGRSTSSIHLFSKWTLFSTAEIYKTPKRSSITVT
jgi:hypothetical protein